MHTDPGCRVPDGSFFNFLWLDTAFAGMRPSQYLHDVELECSSLFTDENVHRLEDACLRLSGRLGAALAGFRLDHETERFQEDVGPELLEALRAGQSYVMDCVASPFDSLPRLFTRDLDAKLFNRQCQSWVFVPDKILSVKVPRSYLSGVDEGSVDLSHLASYLSNAAAWMSMGPRLDPGTIHLLSLYLARSSGESPERDKRRVNEALAVLAAEYVRNPMFVQNLTRRDGGVRNRYARSMIAMATWDDSIVSLAAPVRRLTRIEDGMVSLSDIVQLMVDNRLVRAPKPKEPEGRENVFEPILLGYGDDNATDLVSCPAISETKQARTDLLPRRGLSLFLKEGGIPCLLARSEHGYPSILVPADDKTMTFMARLYGVELPRATRPASREDSMVWSYVYEPVDFANVLAQVERLPAHKGGDARFVDPSLHRRSLVFSGTGDLSKHIPGSSDTDLFFNEFLMH